MARDPGVGTVVGEVYEVDAATLRRLDRLEGHPTLYQRMPILLADGSLVNAYLMKAAELRSSSVIANGDWCRRKELP